MFLSKQEIYIVREIPWRQPIIEPFVVGNSNKSLQLFSSYTFVDIFWNHRSLSYHLLICVRVFEIIRSFRYNHIPHRSHHIILITTALIIRIISHLWSISVYLGVPFKVFHDDLIFILFKLLFHIFILTFQRVGVHLWIIIEVLLTILSRFII